MAKVITIHEPGGPENLICETVDVGEPGPGEVRLKQSVCGLNFIDIYHRTGLYPLPCYPHILGMEAAGWVDAVGSDVTDLSVGERVAYASLPAGAYASERLMPADRVVKLPDTLDDEVAAALMLQGLTVEYLIHRTYPVKAGETVLFHAIAGGVGLLACQWLKQLGATVIGTVGSVEKAQIAEAYGCDHVILYNQENIVARVMEITNNEGVPVVYDSVGAATFEASLNSLRPRGVFVSFGNASGPVKEINPAILAAKGSLYFTRPTLFHYTASKAELADSAQKLFKAYENGLKVTINQRYKLSDVAQAHRDLEARKTTGSTILIAS